MTSRPPTLSCSISGGGSCPSAAVTTIASKGPHSGQPPKPSPSLTLTLSYARSLSAFAAASADERLRHGLAEADRNRPVRVCDGARSLRDEQMAFRLPH